MLWPITIIALFLATSGPPIQLRDGWPVVFGDEILILSLAAIIVIDGLNKGISTRTPSLVAVLIAFIFSMLLSTLMGFEFHDVRVIRGDLLETVRILKVAAVIFVVSQLYIGPDGKRLSLIINMLLLVVIINSIAALLQVFNTPVRDFFFNHYFEAYFTETTLASGDHSGSTTDFINVDKLATILTYRASGLIGGANSLGQMVSSILVGGLTYALISGARGRNRLLFVVAFILGVFTILASGSRGAILLFFVGTVIALTLWITVPNEVRRARKIFLAVTIIITIIVSLLSLGVAINNSGVFPTKIEKRLDRFVDAIRDPLGGSGGKRLGSAKHGFESFIDYPVFGLGPSESDQRTGVADNEILNVLSRYGIVGFAIFATFWVMALRIAHSLSTSHLLPYKAFGYALIAILVMNLLGMLVNNELFDLKRMIITAILLGMAIAALRTGSTTTSFLEGNSDGVFSNGARVTTKT